MKPIQTTALTLLLAPLFGCGALRDDAPPLPADTQSRFVDANGIRLEYFEFGDQGLPVVFVQDHHDYFRTEEAEVWSGHLSRFGDAFRVLAPVRRGWGRSEAPQGGYDIVTQAHDLLGLLDALGIERAIFVGRTLATHEMLWIAENRPERVLALAFVSTPLLAPPEAESSPELQLFQTMYSRTSTDIGQGEEIDRRLERGDWRPQFLSDEALRIDIPTLLTQHPVWDADDASMDLRRLDRIERWDEQERAQWAADPQALEYVEALRRDRGRLAALRREATARAANRKIREAMQRAFGEQLEIAHEDAGRVHSIESAYQESYRVIRPFLERVAAEREVRAAVKAFLAALNGLEWETFQASFADDASVYFPMPDAVLRVDGREAIDGVFGPLFETWRAEAEGTPQLSITPRDVRVQLLGRDGAVVTFGVGDAGRRTMVFERQASGWRIVHVHSSTAAAADRR